MTECTYLGYVIRLDVHEVGTGHPQAGRWVSGEYMIGRHTGGAYTERKFVHDADFFATRTEAEARTLALARGTIDRGAVDF